MIRLGEALTRPDAGVGGPPVRALVVYNSNPAAVAPDRNAVLRGLAREDLFTVVLEHFQTDTADWADFVLPATTQLEHWDVHLAYGHHYVTLNRPAIAPIGEASRTPRSSGSSPRAWDCGIRRCGTTTSRSFARRSRAPDPSMNGVTFEALLANGWVRLNVPAPYVPFAEGGFPTPSGKCEFYPSAWREMGLDPLPAFTPPYEFPESVPALAARFPLTLISSPAHQFLNSTFVNVESLRRSAEPEVLVHPRDAAPTRHRRGRARGGGATIAGASRPWRRSRTACARASCGRRRSGG